MATRTVEMAHSFQERKATAPARGEDVRLMALVAQGDAQARRMLALRLVTRVRRIARHLISPTSDADDATQIAMVEILQSAGSYRGDASIESWMSRIAARAVLRHARKQRRWYAVLGGSREPGDSMAPPPKMADEALPRPLESYLNQLARRHREVLVLKLALDYTVDEIAELLGLPHGTVKGRLVAGRRKLRGLIQRDLKLRPQGDASHPRDRHNTEVDRG